MNVSSSFTARPFDISQTEKHCLTCAQDDGLEWNRILDDIVSSAGDCEYPVFMDIRI